MMIGPFIRSTLLGLTACGGDRATFSMPLKTIISESCRLWSVVELGEEERVVASMLIQEALKRCEGVKLKAADYLGINRNTLNKKYQELGLEHWSD